MEIGSEHVSMGALGVIIVREIIALVKNSYGKQLEATQQNTLAIVRLETKLDSLTRELDLLPKLKADLDVAHDRLRELKGQTSQ